MFDQLGGVAGQRRAIWRDGQENIAPAIHAFLGPGFVIVGHDEEDFEFVAQLGAVFIRHPFSTFQLFAAGHQAIAVELCP